MTYKKLSEVLITKANISHRLSLPFFQLPANPQACHRPHAKTQLEKGNKRPTSPLPHPPAAKSHTDSPDSPAAKTPASPTAATRVPP